MLRRLLIVDATATNRIALKAMLAAARYEPVATLTGAHGLTALKSQTPDAIILDDTLPDMMAETFCQQVHKLAGDAAPPIVVLLNDTNPDRRVRLLRSGADVLISRPVARQWLLTNLRAVLRASETRAEMRRRSQTAAQIGFAEDQTNFDSRGRLAIVGTDTVAARLLARQIRTHTAHRVDVLTPEEALSTSEEPAAPSPELFVLCHGAQSDEDLSLLSELRARRDTKRAAIVVQYGDDSRDIAARALDQGASDLVRDDAVIGEIVLRLERQLRLKRQSDGLRASVDAGLMLAAHDPLTGLFNRRYAMRYLDDLAAQVRDDGRNYALLVLDVDHFKQINDAHGHAAGDAVLVQVARRLSENLREGDLLARIGGEEFLVVLPTGNEVDARTAADRLRIGIAMAPFNTPSGASLRVTMSAGTAWGMDTPGILLEAADAALYRAKELGRNRVEAAVSSARVVIGPQKTTSTDTVVSHRPDVAHLS